MTSNPLTHFFSSPKVTEAINHIEARQLESKIGVQTGDFSNEFVGVLQLAAITSTADLLGDNSVDIWFRPVDSSRADLPKAAHLCFLRWQGYLNVLKKLGEKPTLDDLLMFAMSGMVAQRDHEVRDELRCKICREWLDGLASQIGLLPWLDQVRGNVNAAILFIIRQENHEDIRKGDLTLRKLSEAQNIHESVWLDERPTQQRDASILLGYYHIAEAVVLTAQFLLNGRVDLSGRSVGDFAAELRRILVRSEEFLRFAGNSEDIFWLQTAASSLAFLRSSSIWVQAKGISVPIDKLLYELAGESRQNPIFSLLPAQQDALRESLLDPSRMAIVLQMPTSSGKTLLAEFSIAQTFDAYRGSARIVYLVPTRALATQTRRTLSKDLRPLGINVASAGSAFEEDPYQIQARNLFLNPFFILIVSSKSDF